MISKGSTKLLVILAAAFILVGGVFALSQSNNPGGQSNNSVNSQPDNSEQSKNSRANQKSSSNEGYVEYENGIIEKTSGTKVLYFHADWCPQCRALEEDILAKGVPEGVTIFKVDFDTSRKLRQKYGVTLQTTLVKVDDQGNEIAKYVAYDEPTLESVKENLL